MADLSQLLVLEVENAIIGNSSGAIVERAYHTILERHATEMTEQEKDKLVTAKLLLEYELPFMAVQHKALNSVMESPVATKWASRKGHKWEGASIREKIADVAKTLGKKGGGFSQARRYVDENFERLPTGMRYDVPNNVNSEKVVREVARIFINALRDDQ